MTGAKANKIEILQAGRGLAALAVVLFHANIYTGSVPWLVWGARGVDFFFVLSGFIIYSTRRAKFNAAEYADARLIRIFLPYLPIGIATAIAFGFLGRDGWGWLSSITLLPGSPALRVAWSLQYELFFYAAAGLFLWTGRPLLCAAIWAAVTLVSPTTYVTNVYVLEFLGGMFLAEIWSPPRWTLPRPLVALGDASYSLYLVHLPAMAVVWRVSQSFGVLVAASIAAGFVYYFAWERPALSKLWLGRRVGDNPKLRLAREVILEQA